MPLELSNTTRHASVTLPEQESQQQEPAPKTSASQASWLSAPKRSTLRKLLGTSVVAHKLGSALASSSSCYQYETVASPTTGRLWSVQASCGWGSSYAARFTNTCGAKMSYAAFPGFWHIVKVFFSATLTRQDGDVLPQDNDFQTCLINQAAQQAAHDGKITGIIIGSVVGTALVAVGITLGVCLCCRRSKAASHDVEAPAPEEGQPSAEQALEMQPA